MNKARVIGRLKDFQSELSQRRRVVEAPDPFEEIDRQIEEIEQAIEAEGPMAAYVLMRRDGMDGSYFLQLAKDIGQLQVNGVDERADKAKDVELPPEWKVWTAIPDIPGPTREQIEAEKQARWEKHIAYYGLPGKRRR
jgi:hypothetical protein